MKNKNPIPRLRAAFRILLFILPVLSLGAESLFSPTWNFRLNLPEGYELSGGDGRDQFSFISSFNTSFDLAVYKNRASLSALAEELETKLSNRGEQHRFTYNGKEAVLIELRFANPQGRNAQGQNAQGRNAQGRIDQLSGWALCMELEKEDAGTSGPAPRPLLAAIAYGADRPELQALHLSALDSIEGGPEDHNQPGPVTDYFYPRGVWKSAELANTGQRAYFRENDAAAAQALVDREFGVMKFYLDSPLWQEAWKRFYRTIYKDSFDRLKSAAFILERNWNNSVLGPSGEGVKKEEAERLGKRPDEALSIAAKILEWVQGFRYERDLMGSDFVNLVSAAQEGRGDCDSRALLWAIVLAQADIPAGIMVSREFSHALGMADLEGNGARFPMKNGENREIRWLVAETTAPVAIGLIGESMSEVSKWMGIIFE
jgi:hypothetical protein